MPEPLEIRKELLLDKPLYCHMHGLMQTATGYGAKLATRHMVRIDGRARRIYCAIYSNIGTLYIVHQGEKITVNII